MKLLFAIKKLATAVGGAERVFCTVCSELVRRGYDVTALTFDSPGGQPFYPLDPRVKRLDLGIGDSSSPARLGDTLIRIREMRRHVCVERPDVAIGFMHSMFVPLSLSLVGTGIPVLGSEHIVPEHYRTRRFQYLMLILSAPFLNKLTVLSEEIRARYPSSVKRRMVAIPDPVEAAANSANVGLNKEQFTLLSVGRLDQQKDHATLLRAFAQIASEFPKWHLRIVGEGPLRPQLKDLVEVLALQARVSMPGVTSDIGVEYASAETFVISSRYESFGLVTAEAMSHGLPVVGFADCPGTNELIEPGRTGVLVEPGADRIHSLASALSVLMAEPELRKRMGIAGRDAINNRFTPQSVCDQWEQLLMTFNEH